MLISKIAFKSILLFLLLNINIYLKAQAPTIQWQKSIGGTLEDNPTEMITTVDGGTITVGSTTSNNAAINNHGGWDIYIVKLSSTGVIEWQKCYGGANNDLGFTIAATNDGGYIIGGQTNSQNGDVSGNTFGITNEHAWIIKINANGAIQWQKVIAGGAIGSSAKSVIETNDGGFLFVGNAYMAFPGISYGDGWAVKLSITGGVIWSFFYGGNYHDNFYSVAKTTDGGYIIAGSTASSNLPNYHPATTGITFDYYIVKINANGAIIWQNLFGGAGGEEAKNIIQTTDGGFAVIGYNGGNSGDITGNKGFDDIWLVKLNATGNLQWQKSYGGSYNESGNAIFENSDGSFTIGGYSNSADGDITNYINGADYWILKVNGLNGAIIWQKKYGGTSADLLFSVKPTIDGGIIVMGYSYSNGGDVTGNNGDKDYWIVKLHQTITNINAINNQSNISLYPNPAINFLNLSNLKLSDYWTSLEIKDIHGKTLLYTNEIKNKTRLQLEISYLTQGTYLVVLQQKNGKKVSQKFLKL